MATFFDVGNQFDLLLIPSAVRTDDMLEVMVDESERDILDKFSFRPNGVKEVYLIGYNNVTPASTDADLKADLKRAIAQVAAHRLKHKNTDPSLTSESLGDYSYTRGGADSPQRLDPLWPRGWGTRLKRLYTSSATPIPIV